MTSVGILTSKQGKHNTPGCQECRNSGFRINFNRMMNKHRSATVSIVFGLILTWSLQDGEGQFCDQLQEYSNSKLVEPERLVTKIYTETDTETAIFSFNSNGSSVTGTFCPADWWSGCLWDCGCAKFYKIETPVCQQVIHHNIWWILLFTCWHCGIHGLFLTHISWVNLKTQHNKLHNTDKTVACWSSTPHFKLFFDG